MHFKFFHIAFRNLLKHKLYSAINIIGLSIGLAGFILLMLYVKDELSYDKHFPKADRIYRVVSNLDNNGVGEKSASCIYKLGEDLENLVPQWVDQSVRFYNNWGANSIILHRDKIELENRFYYTDPEVFDMFDVELLKGDKDALNKPFTVALSESSAKKYFPDEDPIDKSLTIRNVDYKVTAVFKDCKPQSHFHWDILGTILTLDSIYGKENLRKNDIWNPFWTYIHLKEGVKPDVVEHFLQENYTDQEIEDKEIFNWSLQSLTRIHLHSSQQYEIESNSKFSHLLILIIAGIFIYLISIINYINLSYALSASRVKEIGVKKILGASYSQLIVQFLGEAILVSVFGLIISLSLVELSLPWLNLNTGKELSFIQLFDSFGIFALLGFAVITGLLSGFYPAIILSGFKPVLILKGVVMPGVSRPMQRKIFVTVQVCISMILFLVALDIFNQTKYFQNTDLGIDKENIVVVPTNYSNIILQYPQYKEELVKHENILDVTHSDYIPGMDHNTHEYMLNCDSASMQFYPSLKVGHDFVKTLGLNLVAGSDFSETDTSIGSSSVLINESMVKHLGYDSAEEILGLSFCSYQGNERIIGVVKDFHHKSLDKAIEPFVIDFPDNITRLSYTKYFLIKISGEDPLSTVSFIKREWEKRGSILPFTYYFLDEKLDQQYHSEEKLGNILFIIAIMSLLIASIGLFGLFSYIIQRKTKEMSIRRVLGAQFYQIFYTLIKDFILLLFIGVSVGWFLSVLIIKQLTHVYAYHASIYVSDFVIVTWIVILSFALMSLFAAMRITMRSPTESLSYE